MGPEWDFKHKRPKNSELYKLKIRGRSLRNFYRVYPPCRGLRGWSTTSNNKSNMTDTGNLELQTAHWRCIVITPMQKPSGKSIKLEPLHWFLR